MTVEADPAGKTQIQFSGREAQGDFGRCVGKVALAAPGDPRSLPEILETMVRRR